MRAAVTTTPNAPLALADLDTPEPAPGEVLVRIGACGICGSDLHLSQVWPASGLVLGHECAGEVVDVGAGVDAGVARVGDLVAVFPVVGCGTCSWCRAGSPSKCDQMAQLGLQRAGAFAQYTTAAARGVFKLPSSFDARVGAMVEPLAVAHHALDRTPRPADEPVLVIGAGPVGAAVALWARALGARDVVVSDPVADRRALAERVGATATIDPASEDVAAAFGRLTGGAPRVVVECVGVGGMIQHAVDVAATDAAVTVVGVCIGTDTVYPLTALQKELALQFVLYYREDDFTRTIAALDRELVDPSPLVTGVIGLDDLPERFESLKRPTTDCKVLVEP